ncbi:MAG: glycosyltransferase family 2 protein [Bacteroidia bacterium]
MVDLCIVIPTFNRKKQLSILLDQFKKQDCKILNYKIVVVVDGSTDGTIELIKIQFPDVHVIKGNGNWWFTRSLNEGCKYAVNNLQAGLILTINDDVQIPDDYLSLIMNNYNQCEPNSIIGSCSYSLDDPTMITFAGIKSQNWLMKYFYYIKGQTKVDVKKLKGVKPSVTLPTRGLLIPSTILKAVNYFDEKCFPQYASDFDFVLRAARNKVKIFISYDAYVLEDTKLTSKGNPRLANGFKNFLKNVFFNKYSSNYFFKDLHMAWRFGNKILFPIYFVRIIVAIPYIYFKYNPFRIKDV